MAKARMPSVKKKSKKCKYLYVLHSLLKFFGFFYWVVFYNTLLILM